MGRSKVDDKIKFVQVGLKESVIELLTEREIKQEAKKHINKMYDEKKEIQAGKLQQKGQ